MNDRVKYWFELSIYDLETADAMLKSLNQAKCQEILIDTTELQEWIKLKL